MNDAEWKQFASQIGFPFICPKCSRAFMNEIYELMHEIECIAK